MSLAQLALTAAAALAACVRAAAASDAAAVAPPAPGPAPAAVPVAVPAEHASLSAGDFGPSAPFRNFWGTQPLGAHIEPPRGTLDGTNNSALACGRSAQLHSNFRALVRRIIKNCPGRQYCRALSVFPASSCMATNAVRHPVPAAGALS